MSEGGGRTVVGEEELEEYVPSLAWVTVAVHVPAAVADIVVLVPLPESEQLAEPALVTAKEIAPLPEPPEQVSVSAVFVKPEVEVRSIAAGVAAAEGDRRRGRRCRVVQVGVGSSASVAVTVQVPSLVAVTVNPPPVREQLAVPADVTA